MMPGSVSVSDAGGGAGAPVDGISPASAEPESTHASAIANARRFIVWGSPLSFEHASYFAVKPE